MSRPDRCRGILAHILFLVFLVLWAGGGCRRGVPFTIVPVSGRVTYTDGRLIPANRLVVTFVPQVEAEGNISPRPATATVGADGNFSAMTTRKYGDGAIVGRNKVVVVAMGEHKMQTQAVPAIYSNAATTPLEVEVTRESPPFTIMVEKPKMQPLDEE